MSWFSFAVFQILFALGFWQFDYNVALCISFHLFFLESSEFHECVDSCFLSFVLSNLGNICPLSLQIFFLPLSFLFTWVTITCVLVCFIVQSSLRLCSFISTFTNYFFCLLKSSIETSSEFLILVIEFFISRIFAWFLCIILIFFLIDYSFCITLMVSISPLIC